MKEYRDEGEITKLKKNRRPKTYLTDEQKKIIEEAWREIQIGVRLLYYELRKRGYMIPPNKIHRYCRETGKSKENPKKQKKRKRRRYERKYSGSLIHGDWHRSDDSKPYAIVWMDDASRYVLDGAELQRQQRSTV